MDYLRCIHPPGGATALAAVIGGDVTTCTGLPVHTDTGAAEHALVILLVAVLFNYPFDWRRYPVRAGAEREAAAGYRAGTRRQHTLNHADLELAALAEIDSFIDVSEHDLLRIYDIATGQSGARQLAADRIVLGHYYSNGAFGADWCVRQIVDESPHTDPDRDMVVFKVAAGQGLRTSGVITRAAFARWAKHELVRDDENWKRVS